MPFTHEQFLDLFARYNQALWPVELVLWLASAAALASVLRAPVARSRWIAGLLAFHWAWSGIVYHAVFFTTINTAAWFFAALFVLEAAWLAWRGVIQPRVHFAVGGNAWQAAGCAIAAYGLLYPAVNLLTGLAWPRAPLFAVPCPTTLLTAGLLLATEPPLPPGLVVVPVLWSCLGVIAALQFGVRADLALPVAAAVLLLRTASQALVRRTRAMP